MSDQPQQAAPLLFFSSRTARDNFFFCPRYRYLGNHFGPSGYGIQPARQSIPLATGGRIHDVLRPILEYTLQHDTVPPQAVIVEAAMAGVQQYQLDVQNKGLSYWGDEQSYKRMVEENSHLIAGLPMVWTKYILPRLLEDWRPVLVEPREVSVYKCTCRLGDGIPQWTDHVARGCQGIALMTGPDLVCQHRRAQHSYRYDEFKSRNAPLTDAWAESYETRVQVQLGTLGVEQKYGIEIHEVYLHGLCKGQYRKSKELGEYQDSRLCWAWKRPAAPPMTTDEWAYEYERWDEAEQRTKRLGKGYERTWVGDYPGGLPAWIDTLPDYTLAKMLRTVGPLPRNPVAKQNALEGWVELEFDIQIKLGSIYTALEQVGFDWTHPSIVSLLNQYFPQSWDCQRFGSRYPCAMKKICHHEPGWQDPFTIGYVNRRPHHPAELEQAIGRGCILPDDEYEEPEDPQ